MFLTLLAEAAISQTNQFIAPCSLPRTATFYEKIDIVPAPVLDDFYANAGRVVNPGQPVNFSDFGPQDMPTQAWRYILNIGDMWIISYVQGGIVIRNVTVGYSLWERDNVGYIGAVEGDVCAAIDYLRGSARIRVLEGWRRRPTDAGPATTAIDQRR